VGFSIQKVIFFWQDPLAKDVHMRNLSLKSDFLSLSLFRIMRGFPPQKRNLKTELQFYFSNTENKGDFFPLKTFVTERRKAEILSLRI